MFYPCPESLMDAKNCSSKRVSRACDRCRLKKTKCDGRRCCNRCLADDAICVFSKRKRSSDRPYSSEYVQLLEDQQMKLVEGVQELYRKLRKGEGWDGPAIAEDSQGYPLVQDVLDSLAVLAPCERGQPKKKVDDKSISEQDDEEEESPDYDDSGCIGSTPPSLSPLDSSQSPESSSFIGDCSTSNFNMPYMQTQYGQQISGPLNTVSDICQTDELLQNPTTQIDGAAYWPLSSTFDVAGGVVEFTDLIDPFISMQANNNWYQGSYVV